LAVRARMCYMHDGVAVHFSRAVREFLNNAYHDRWIGTWGPTAWPPRSPDLNSLVFYLWGHNRIVDTCETIRNCPGIFERMRRSIMRRVEACIESHGGHFGHLFKCTLPAITHKIFFSGPLLLFIYIYIYIYIYIFVCVCVCVCVTLKYRIDSKKLF
jgi:hypothetical protein